MKKVLLKIKYGYNMPGDTIDLADEKVAEMLPFSEIEIIEEVKKPQKRSPRKKKDESANADR